MIFLPIVERELRARARSRSTFWMRCLAAAVGVSACFPQQTALASLGAPASVGKQLFDTLVVAAFLAACCACLLSADSISGERREGTLGLLFLTVVKSSDVLLGKLMSAGLTGLGALLSLFPVLMLPVLVGGVDPGDALRKAAGLLATLFFALAVGLLVSARQRERGRAVRRAVLIVVLLVLLPFYVRAAAPQTAPGALGLLSPLVLMTSASIPAFQTSPSIYWSSLTAVLLEATGMVFLAGFLLRRSAFDDTAAPIGPVPSTDDPGRTVGLSRWRPARQETDPIEWLVYRQYGVSAWFWFLAVLSLVASRWLAFGQHIGGSALFTLFVWPVGLGGALMGGALVAWLASRFFAATRLNGELELLLTTPVGASTVVLDQWKVLQRLFVRPVLVMQIATLIPFMVLTSPLSGRASWGHGMPDLLGALLTFVNTYLGTEAVCWLGLRFGLKTSGQAGAIIRAAGLAAGVPWFFSLCATLVSGGQMGMPGGTFCELLILGFNLWLISSTRRRLQVELAGEDLAPSPVPLAFARRGLQPAL